MSAEWVAAVAGVIGAIVAVLSLIRTWKGQESSSVEVDAPTNAPTTPPRPRPHRPTPDDNERQTSKPSATEQDDFLQIMVFVLVHGLFYYLYFDDAEARDYVPLPGDSVLLVVALITSIAWAARSLKVGHKITWILPVIWILFDLFFVYGFVNLSERVG